MRHRLISNLLLAGACAAALAVTQAAHAQGAEDASCRTVRFVDIGWTDITSTTALASVVFEGLGYAPRTTGVELTPIAVISGRSEFKENSAVQMRCVSSGQRTVMDSGEAETVIGPGRTAEISAGTVAATLMKGIKKIRGLIRLGSGTTSYPRSSGVRL